MGKIKLIAFDFGGVYYAYNHNKLISDIAKEVNISAKDVQKAWSKKIIDFEKGLCNENDFWNSFLKLINKKLNKRKLNTIVINHFQLISGMNKIIKKLKLNYKIALVSNQTTWLDELNLKYKFYQKFDYLIISKNECLRKPEKAIFNLLIKKSKLKPKQILFIDDNLSYGKFVKKYGINFIHFKDPIQLKEKLTKYQIIF